MADLTDKDEEVLPADFAARKREALGSLGITDEDMDNAHRIYWREQEAAISAHAAVCSEVYRT